MDDNLLKPTSNLTSPLCQSRLHVAVHDYTKRTIDNMGIYYMVDTMDVAIYATMRRPVSEDFLLDQWTLRIAKRIVNIC